MNRLVATLLASSRLPLFTTADIVHAVAGSDDVRYALVKRALADGDLIRIKRALYTLPHRYRKVEVSAYTISSMIVSQSYISLESALSYHGWIPEAVRSVTAVTHKNSVEYHTPMGHFTYAKVPQRTFYAGVRRIDEGDGNVWFLAAPLKALADYVYLHRLDWDSSRPLSHSLRIEEEEISSLTELDFLELEGVYTNKRVVHFLASLKEEVCGERSHH